MELKVGERITLLVGDSIQIGEILVNDIKENGSILGRLVKDAIPLDIRLLLQEAEQLINDQCFTVLDEVQSKVDSKGLFIETPKGKQLSISSFRIMEETGAHFKINEI